MESKIVDFGASDPPLKEEDEAALAKNGSPAVQIPMLLGAITEAESAERTGLTLEEIRGRSFAKILRDRSADGRHAE